MIKVTPDEGRTKTYYEEKKSTVTDQTPKCPTNTFRLLGFGVEAMQDARGYSHITLSWMDNKDAKDTRYDFKAYVQPIDFLRYVAEDFDSLDQEEIFS